MVSRKRAGSPNLTDAHIHMGSDVLKRIYALRREEVMDSIFYLVNNVNNTLIKKSVKVQS